MSQNGQNKNAGKAKSFRPPAQEESFQAQRVRANSRERTASSRVSPASLSNQESLLTKILLSAIVQRNAGSARTLPAHGVTSSSSLASLKRWLGFTADEPSQDQQGKAESESSIDDAEADNSQVDTGYGSNPVTLFDSTDSAPRSSLLSKTPSELQTLVARYTSEEVGAPAGGSTLEKVYKLLGTLFPKTKQGQLAMGGVTGWISGYLAMKIGKTAAFAIGTGLLMLQAAHYSGYVQIDWPKIHRDLAERGREFIRRSKVEELSNPTLLDFADRNKHITAGFVGGFLLGIASS